MEKKRWLLDYDEISRLGMVSYISAVQETEGLSGQEQVRKQADMFIDDLLSLLLLSYERGIRDVGEMLGFAPRLNSRAMEAAIYEKIDGKTFEDRVREHVAAQDTGRLASLTESEAHRVYSQAGEDAARQAAAPVQKTWVTMGDPHVRDTHDYIDGASVSLDEEFYTFDGDHAMRPGGFQLAENNVNCRCWLRYQYA